MSDFEGNFLEGIPHWDSPLSPDSLQTIFNMLNQSDNDQNPVTEISSQSNIPSDQPEQRSGGCTERLASGTQFPPPTFDTEIMSPFNSLFEDPLIVPSSNAPISLEFNPATLLQSPNMMFGSSQIPLSTNEGHATALVSNNDQPMHVHMPPQRAGDTDENPLIIDVDEDENKDEDHNILNIGELEIGESSSKIRIPRIRCMQRRRNITSRRYERASTMIGATRKTNQQRVIIQMECEEDNPDDGYKWRKYGEKVVKGNPNARGYYKCTYDRCKVNKHVERGAENVKLLVITYDGKHKHDVPAPRTYGRKNRDGSRRQLGRQPSTSWSPIDTSPSFPSLAPQLYMAGPPSLSHNPNFGLMYPNGHPPVNQNSGFLYRNDHLVHQNSSSMNQNHQLVHHNPGLMSRAEQSVNHDSGGNSNYMFHNDQPVSHCQNAFDWNDQSVH